MPWFVYILECAGDRLYVGMTTDVDARFGRHLAGDAAVFTRKHPAVRMMLWEPHETQTCATQRERQLKRLSSAKKWALAEGRLDVLRSLAKRRQQ